MASYRLYACIDIWMSRKQTKFVTMLLALEEIPAWWGRIAHVFGWILLQGYVVFPSIFTTYNPDGVQAETSLWGKVKSELIFLVQDVPL